MLVLFDLPGQLRNRLFERVEPRCELVDRRAGGRSDRDARVGRGDFGRLEGRVAAWKHLALDRLQLLFDPIDALIQRLRGLRREGGQGRRGEQGGENDAKAGHAGSNVSASGLVRTKSIKRMTLG